MDFRLLVALALVVLAPACSALVAPDPARLGGTDASVDGGTEGRDANLPDGAVPDANLPDGNLPDTSVPDGGPVCPASCDDAVPCTTDSCDAASGTCANAPNDAVCGDGMRCAGPAGCVPILCTSAAECDDGNACNGSETCNPGGAGASPTTGCVGGGAIDCSDDSDCTEDHCDPGTGCLHVANDAACDDGADCTADACTASGCVSTPNDALCNGGCRTGAMCTRGSGCSGGTSISCTTDGNPCTSDPVMCDVASGMCLHPARDDDGDGHAIARATGGAGTVTCPGGDDCNDMNPAVYSGATEVCNRVDDDCDGVADDGLMCGTPPDTCATEGRITMTSTGGGVSVGSVTGNNSTLADDYGVSCGGDGGRDAVHVVSFGSGSAIDVTISTVNPGTTFDTVLGAEVRSPGSDSCGTFGRACQDDVSSTERRSTITFCVTRTSGANVHILVDGYDGSASSIGTYELTVRASPRAGGVCP